SQMIRKTMILSGSTICSRICALPYSGFARMYGMMDSATSCTACWNSDSPGLRFFTPFMKDWTALRTSDFDGLDVLDIDYLFSGGEDRVRMGAPRGGPVMLCRQSARDNRNAP